MKIFVGHWRHGNELNRRALGRNPQVQQYIRAKWKKKMTPIKEAKRKCPEMLRDKEWDTDEVKRRDCLQEGREMMHNASKKFVG